MSDPRGDNKDAPIDRGLKLLARFLPAGSSVALFVLRGWISGSMPIILLVAVLCGLAVFSNSWRSLGFLALGYSTTEFVCTLGPGSNPCEPLNGPRILAVFVATAALFALDLWYKVRKVLRGLPS